MYKYYVNASPLTHAPLRMKSHLSPPISSSLAMHSTQLPGGMRAMGPSRLGHWDEHATEEEGPEPPPLLPDVMLTTRNGPRGASTNTRSSKAKRAKLWILGSDKKWAAIT